MSILRSFEANSYSHLKLRRKTVNRDVIVPAPNRVCNMNMYELRSHHKQNKFEVVSHIVPYSQH